MSCAVNQTAPDAIKLAGELSIAEVADVTPDLLSASSSNDTLNLDLSGITTLDTAGLQLLMLLKHKCPDTRLVEPSEPVRSMAALFRQHSLITG